MAFFLVAFFLVAFFLVAFFLVAFFFAAFFFAILPPYGMWLLSFVTGTEISLQVG